MSGGREMRPRGRRVPREAPSRSRPDALTEESWLDDGSASAGAGGRAGSAHSDRQDAGTPAPILGRRLAAERARARRRLFVDAASAALVVVVAVAAGMGIGLLGVLAVLVFVVIGLVGTAGRMRVRRRRRRRRHR
ncbi:MAG: hypothetical protein ACYCU0_06060 [Solirubrobacteraceae bacterium]